MRPRLDLIQPQNAILIIIDIQEKFLPVIRNVDKLINNTIFLTKVANLFQLPIICTEQNPEGLGRTDSRILNALEQKASFFSKITFSIWQDENIRKAIIARERSSIILAGIETNICILQSSLDLIKTGFDVYLAVDAISSRYELDHALTLERLTHAGAILTTSETLAFELVKSADNERFKDLLKLIKEIGR